MPIGNIVDTLSYRPNARNEVPPRIFCIEELLLLILSFLSIGDISRFALTNRTVVDAALDLVWRRSENLAPLFKLLPHDAVRWGTRKRDWCHMVCRK